MEEQSDNTIKDQGVPCSLEEQCENLRGTVIDVGGFIKALMNHGDFKGEQSFEGQHGEMKANIMLAYRHMEDARMRLGKVMQQIQGGVSIFDRPDAPASETADTK